MLVDYLKTDLAERCRKNPRYSLRAYAQALRIDSGTLSSILSGRRPLTPKTARRLLNELPLDPSLRAHFLVSTVSTGEAPKAGNRRELSEDELKVIAGWEHFAILALLETRKTPSPLVAVSSRLDLPSGIALEALTRLQRLGIVVRKGTGWMASGASLGTTQDVPSAALRKAHQEYLGKALESLHQDTVEDRDFSGVTMAISKARLPEAKRLIREFRRNLAALLESGIQEEVYRLNVQLFPLTRQKGRRP